MKRLLFAAFLVLLFAGSSKAQTHQVVVNWTASTTTTVTGYNFYKIVGSCPTSPTLANFSKVNSTPITVLTFTDTGLTAGSWYCYTVTAVAPAGESVINTVAQVNIPTIIPVSAPPAAPASVAVGSVQ